MIRMTAFLLVMLAVTPAYADTTPSAMRCGWIDNPTPGNYFLNDKDGSWEISAQGTYEAEGMDLIPDLSGDQFVDIGPHGYGCGCMDASADMADKKILQIYKFEQKKLKDCLADPDLPAMVK